MEPIADTWVKNFRSVVVKIKDGTTITGKLNIGDFPRVSDFFRKSPDQYFVLSDAEHRGTPERSLLLTNMRLCGPSRKIFKRLGNSSSYQNHKPFNGPLFMP